MRNSHNIRCYVIFPGVVLTADVYIFKYAKKYLLCRPFVWLHPLEGFKRFQCPVQNLQSSINWFQSSCAWSSYLDLLLYACALCTQPNHTKRRFSNRLKTSLKENGFASEAGSTFHIQCKCCKVGVGRIVNLHVHIVFLLLVINSIEQKLGKAGAELNGNVIFDILEPPAFQNIAYVGYFKHFSVQLFFYMYFAIQPRPAPTAVGMNMSTMSILVGEVAWFRGGGVRKRLNWRRRIFCCGHTGGVGNWRDS